MDASFAALAIRSQAPPTMESAPQSSFLIINKPDVAAGPYVRRQFPLQSSNQEG
jgi:hypothetical protein